ncbi:MAG: exodeoxyribonuclease III [Microbacteriaceae bacterium]
METNSLTIASINVNGIRAAFRKGFAEWLAANPVDIVALQEVRATRAEVEPLLADLDGEWHFVNDEASAKGRAGVAILSRIAPVAVRTNIGPEDFDTAGRWLEADFEHAGERVTVVSCYVHSGEADTPKQVEKYKFLDAMIEYLPQLEAKNPLSVVVGDLNVGHRELDIKNWRGNVKRAGFMPQERAYFDQFFGASGAVVDCVDGTSAPGLGWIDIGRKFAGEVDGPYTWWSQRGQAFDNDTGWRIDYQMATPALAAKVADYRVHRAASYAERWTDHSPVVVKYVFA